MNLKDFLSKAPWELKHNRKAVIVVAGVFLVLASEAALYFPIQASLGSTQRRLSDKTKEMDMAKATGLTQISPAELAKLQQRMSYFKEGFVKVDEIATVLNRISDLAEKNNIRVVSINSEDALPVKSDAEGGEGPKFKRLPIRMSLEGVYPAFAEFLDALSRSQRQVFVVESYDIGKAKESATLTCDMVLSFFSAV